MSLDRKDVRAKLDPEMHGALSTFADIDGVDIGEFVEQLIVAAVRKRIHDTIEAAAELRRQGITGNRRENPGSGK